MNRNPNCDGSNCRSAGGEVRRLPTGGDSAAIVCADCYCEEIRFRIQRNRDLEDSCKFPLPAWSDLEIYLPATEPQPDHSKLSWKLYRCKECKTPTRHSTNHFGETYSHGSLDACPQCPPYKRPTVWECIEPKPPGAWVPEPWAPTVVEVKRKRKRKI